MFINLAKGATYVATYRIAGSLTARANRRKHSSQHHSGTVGNGLAEGGRVRNNVLPQTAGSLSVFLPLLFASLLSVYFAGTSLSFFLFFSSSFLWIVASLSVGLGHVITDMLRIADPFTSVSGFVDLCTWLLRYEVGFASSCKLHVDCVWTVLVFLLNVGLAVSAFMLTTTITTTRGAPAYACSSPHALLQGHSLLRRFMLGDLPDRRMRLRS
ncbi:hypothetical protein BDP55DRAFT_21109 [Colletotrichum godetiae]|uniref:Uncharacterized protein n=1 Tax=Colletotrichum godetiae TaxID=1209918 RepID=A0AAJ0B002_9PEZI|nr:uncharacterized protein BDP55DRAFT_21109 [Colletotrichum godetiae]KAK1701438.1 hypothetical protein BDP55DRAFT_21109 [Colletotrichum godetiae]